jgi:hypothetical protein
VQEVFDLSDVSCLKGQISKKGCGSSPAVPVNQLQEHLTIWGMFCLPEDFHQKCATQSTKSMKVQKKRTLSFLNPKVNGLVLVYFVDNHKFQQLQNKDLLELEIEN